MAREPAAPEAVLRLRALSHPLRWRLLDLLEHAGSATATRCADELGERVASCSYHLGILGKYGYTELVPDVVGREKPWRIRSSPEDLSAQSADPEEQLAARAAGEAFLDHELERMKEWLRRARQDEPAWRDACTAAGSTIQVTSQELAEIKAGIGRMLDPYERRGADPAGHPPTARRARVFFSTSVDPSR